MPNGKNENHVDKKNDVIFNTGTAACYRCMCYNTAEAVSGLDLYFAAYLRD